jgi:hypothetical protein
MRHKLRTRVTLDPSRLSPGNAAYWREHGGDLRGVVTLRNGQRCRVTFSNGLANWFDDDVLTAEDGQGVLL